MFRKFVLTSFAGCVLAMSAMAAEIVVKIGPPAAIVERRPVAPGPAYVWIPGYHRWDGNRYVWVGGEWRMPPHPHARWVAHRWVHRHDGYVFVEGHWR